MRSQNRKSSLAVFLIRTVVVLASGFAVWNVLTAAIPVAFAAKPDVITAQPSNDLATAPALTQDVTQGALRVVKEDGKIVECPLKHTDVQAEICGFITRVKVTQVFFNPLDEKIEALYVFPLPHEAAVDAMTMVVGERRIMGSIQRRAAARRIYERALAAGQTTALLEQERPNIFTQSVGNIAPQQEVKIEISYFDVLTYDMGTYEFRFPMVVGPRYIPGTPTSIVPPLPEELKGKVGELDKSQIVEGSDTPKGAGRSPDTDRVPDASRITPPALKPDMRTGHDISLSVSLDAGVPIQDMQVASHDTTVQRTGNSKADITLSPADGIPNKDFVLRYNVVGKKPEMAVLCNTDESNVGYFMLMIQPKEDERLTKSPPREISFLVDVSGSMSGEPTEKVKDVMSNLLNLCRPQDTIQVITFSSTAQKLFEKAVSVTPQNIQTALDFTRLIQGGGGTEMLKGVKMVIGDPLDPERLRIVIMLTDGFIGNEAEIIAEVGRSCGDKIRFWCIGIGSSPNQFLVDGVAKQGGGMSKVLGLKDDSMAMAHEIMTRIQRAQLANVRIDWGRLSVFDAYPAKLPELWAGRPVVVFGRYESGVLQNNVTVHGNVEGEAVSWPLTADFPVQEPSNEALAKVWARQKIEDLMQQTFYAGSPEVEEAVTQIALDYRLMSQYTSFVAVDERELATLAQPAHPPRRMIVPVPLPEGTRYTGFFAEDAISGHKYDEKMNSEKETIQVVTRVTRMDTATKYTPSSYAGGRVGTLREWYINGVSTGGFLTRKLAPPTVGLHLPSMDGPPTFSGDSKQHDISRFIKSAAELRENGELIPAREQLVRSVMLDTDGRFAPTAMTTTQIQEINEEIFKTRVATLPALENKLNFIIRDKSVAEALQAVDRAADVEIELRNGSVEDVCALLHRKTLRVEYLDLRSATVAQALDWMLYPTHMNWWLEDGKIVAGTIRRCNVQSAWIYDINGITTPEIAETLPAAMQKALSLTSDDVLWYAPGLIMIFGNAKTHWLASVLIADLANADAKLDDDLKKIHMVTVKRAGETQDRMSHLARENEVNYVVGLLSQGSWALCAAASQGKLDEEALTRLQIAWQSPEMSEVLKLPTATIAMRSIWAITESASALPGEEELAVLAASARELVTRNTVRDVIAVLEQSPENLEAYFSVLYAALAMRNDADFPVKAASALMKVGADSPLAAARTVANALTAPPGNVRAFELSNLILNNPDQVKGDDMVCLTALACRRAGGEAWSAFRARSKDILGRQPLYGSVIVLVNSLGRPRLPIIAAAMK